MNFDDFSMFHSLSECSTAIVCTKTRQQKITSINVVSHSCAHRTIFISPFIFFFCFSYCSGWWDGRVKIRRVRRPFTNNKWLAPSTRRQCKWSHLYKRSYDNLPTPKHINSHRANERDTLFIIDTACHRRESGFGLLILVDAWWQKSIGGTNWVPFFVLLILLEKRLTMLCVWRILAVVWSQLFGKTIFSFIVFDRIEPAKYTFHIGCISSDSKLLVDVDPFNGNLQYL